MPTTVLFLCPHAAAKSVMAAALLLREAAERGLDVQVSNAGTEPDAEVLPLVRDRLEVRGLTILEPPSLVTEAALARADIIVNIGCSHDDLPTKKPIRDWRIPDFGDDPRAAATALETHVTQLVIEMSH